jgi:hypothetical protein
MPSEIFRLLGVHKCTCMDLRMQVRKTVKCGNSHESVRAPNMFYRKRKVTLEVVKGAMEFLTTS